MAGDKYSSFKDLAAAEVRGTDYDTEWRRKPGSSVAVIAPHGGKIEPLTDKIADAIAGKDFSFYCFRGLKAKGGLHVASHLFDDPDCERLIADHAYVVSIHGWGELSERLCVGGLDNDLMEALRKSLAENGIRVERAGVGLGAADARNIVNRGATGRGVQFELTKGFRTNAAKRRIFVGVVRAVLHDAQQVRQCR